MDCEIMMEYDNTEIVNGIDKASGICVEIIFSPDEFFLHSDHKIDNKIIFPSMGNLVIAWKAFAKIHNEDYKTLSVVIEEMRFKEAIEIPEHHSIKFVVNILENTGEFKICVDDFLTATGRIRILNKIEMDELYLPVPESLNDSEYLELTADDVYKILNKRGYDYNGIFKAIRSSDNGSAIGELGWHENWNSFMDTMLQFKILSLNTNDLLLPIGIEYAAIKPVMHEKCIANSAAKNEGVPIYNYSEINIIKSGGIELRGIETSSITRAQIPHDPPINSSYSFVPFDNCPNAWKYYENSRPAHDISLTTFVQIVMENIESSRIEAVEIAGERSAESLLAPLVLDIVYNEPNKSMDLQIISETPENYEALAEEFNFQSISRNVNNAPAGSDLHLIIAADILTKENSIIFENLESSLRPGGFIILEEPLIDGDIEIFCDKMLRNAKLLVIGKRYTQGKVYILLRSEKQLMDMDGWNEAWTIYMNSKDFSWLVPLQETLKSSKIEEQKILVKCKNGMSGLIGLVNCLRVEYPKVNMSYVYMEKKYEKECTLAEYEQQMKKQLTVNVFKDGKWGTYRHLNLSPHRSIRIKPFTFTTDMTIENLMNCARTKIFVCNNIRQIDFDINEKEYEDHSNRIYTEDLLNRSYSGTHTRFIMNAMNPSNYNYQFCPFNLSTAKHLKRRSLPGNSWTLPVYPKSLDERDSKNWELVYSSLNLRYLLANQKLTKDVFTIVKSGVESGFYAVINDGFSGRDHTGQRIMGILKTKLRLDTDWKYHAVPYIHSDKLGYGWGVPESWTLKEAATVPFPYTMGYWCLVVKGCLKPGQSVLIHDGTESIGQACISIALHASCNVFTTVNSTMKIEYLKKNFPDLNDKNILLRLSEEETYQDFVLAGTSGKGVDVIVNSLTPHKLNINEDCDSPLTTPRCLTPNGRFVERGSFDFILEHWNKYCEHPLNEDIKIIIQLVNEGIESGAVRPLSSYVFNEANIREAYQFMDSTCDVGIALLKLHDDGLCDSIVKRVEGVSRIRMSPWKAYVLISDLGDFDIEFIEWMISRGAKYIVIVTRSTRTGYQSLRIRRWRESGIVVTFSDREVFFELEVQLVLKTVKNIAPIGGIFHFPSVHKPELFPNQLEKDFAAAPSRRIHEIFHLDIVSRKFCPNLEYFVVFSSTASSRGKVGESNIGFGNSMIERIAERRKASGSPATVILGEPELSQTSELKNGQTAQSTSSYLETIEFFLQQPNPVLSSIVLARAEV